MEIENQKYKFFQIVLLLGVVFLYWLYDLISNNFYTFLWFILVGVIIFLVVRGNIKPPSNLGTPPPTDHF